jgi:hypothetical protein
MTTKLIFLKERGFGLLILAPEFAFMSRQDIGVGFTDT